MKKLTRNSAGLPAIIRYAPTALFALIASAFLVPVAAAQSVTGEVTDAGRTVTFKGASVRIDELSRGLRSSYLRTISARSESRFVGEDTVMPYPWLFLS